MDLPWYWGTGSSTAQGDTGLRSSLGGQLDALRAGVVSEHAVDSSQAEGDMIRRLSAAHRAEEIHRRLRTLPGEVALVLRLHYGTRSLAAGVSGAALLCPAAAAMCGGGTVSREGLTEAIRVSLRARDNAWVALTAEALTMVREAVEAYERAEVARRRKVWGE